MDLLCELNPSAVPTLLTTASMVSQPNLHTLPTWSQGVCPPRYILNTTLSLHLTEEKKIKLQGRDLSKVPWIRTLPVRSLPSLITLPFPVGHVTLYPKLSPSHFLSLDSPQLTVKNQTIAKLQSLPFGQPKIREI
jgi:hypothetical protein